MDIMSQVTTDAVTNYNPDTFDLQATLDSYVADLRDLYNDDVALEAAGAGNAVLTKLKDFVNRVKTKLGDIIRNIIDRLRFMINGFRNYFTGTVKVPDEAGNAFQSIMKDLEEVDKNCYDYWSTVTEFHRQLTSANTFLFNRREHISKVFDDQDELIEKMKDKIRHMGSVDVLKGTSAEEYASNLREENARTKEINIRQAQTRLDKLDSNWRRHQKVAGEMVSTIASALNSTEAIGKAKNDSETVESTRVMRDIYSRVYNNSMATCAGMLKSISYAQRYLTVFRLLSKHAPVSANVREARPTVGVLPAHA